jgi:putative hemolysin
VLGGDPSASDEEITDEELRDLMVAQRRFTLDQRHIIEGAFEIADRPLRVVLIPRRDVVVLADDESTSVGMDKLARSGHSRAPVVTHDLDDVTGVVHLRDLVGGAGTVGERARPPLVLPESVDVLDALRRMQTEHQQMAIVVNEYGATEGIVTLEDLIEELVGEIYDETDRDLGAVQRQPDGAFVLAGTFPVHDLTDLGIDLPEGDYATMAGLVLDRLGHVPTTAGETVDIDGWRLEALAIA